MQKILRAGHCPTSTPYRIIADWREELSSRLQRAQLRHELIGLDWEEITALGDEAREFQRLCAVLKGVIHA